MRRILVLLTAAAGLLSSLAWARPLELDDMYRFHDVDDASIAPNGEWVAYTVSSIDKEQDKSVSDLWMTRWDGTATLQLTSTAKSESTPRWSPDGSKLAFLADRSEEEKGAQVWLLDMRGGEAQQLTDLEHAISDFTWSPDGTRLALVAKVAPPEADKEDDKEDGEAKPKPIVVNRYHFKEDVTGYLGVERSHLFLFDIASRGATQLTDGSYNEQQPSWSPDGKRIAFVSKRGDDMDRHENWNVWIMEAQAGASAVQLTTNTGADGNSNDSDRPRFSPDGSRLAYLRGGKPEDIWYALTQIATIPAAGGNEGLPTVTLDRNSRQPRWSANGSRIVFLLEDDQSVQLAEVRLRDNRVERLTAPGRVVHGYDMSINGRIALIVSTPEQPAEVWKFERGRLRQLSHHNEAIVNEVDLLPAQTIRFNSADGLEIHGMVIRPDKAGDGKVPLVIRIHGGPVSQYQYEFDFEWQMFAARGYLVAGINPRGSTGRGEEFQKLLFANWGYADVPDIMAAVDHLIESHGVDPERMGVGGWSYGGILTNYVIASTDRFKVAVSGSSMSNMLGGYGHDQYIVEWEKELGKPWENTDSWLRLSFPFLEANRISTPTLFLCGAADFNVPLAASEHMYQALRSLDVPTELIIYPDQFHSLTRASFEHDKRRRYLEWYDRYLK